MLYFKHLHPHQAALECPPPWPGLRWLLPLPAPQWCLQTLVSQRVFSATETAVLIMQRVQKHKITKWMTEKRKNELSLCRHCLSSHTSRGVADSRARGGDFGDSGRIVCPRSPTNLDLQVTVWVDLLHAAHLSKGLWKNDRCACDCWLQAMLSVSRPIAGRGTMERAC